MYCGYFTLYSKNKLFCLAPDHVFAEASLARILRGVCIGSTQGSWGRLLKWLVSTVTTEPSVFWQSVPDLSFGIPFQRKGEVRMLFNYEPGSSFHQRDVTYDGFTDIRTRGFVASNAIFCKLCVLLAVIAFFQRG